MATTRPISAAAIAIIAKVGASAQLMFLIVRYVVPAPVEAYYGPYCYYDNGYDLQVHLICRRGW